MIKYTLLLDNTLQNEYNLYMLHKKSIKGGKKMSLIRCPGCGNGVSANAFSCPNCGEPINTAIRCPKCGSSNTKVISGASKAASVAMWGIFASNKVLSKNVCCDCRHKF